MKIIIVPTDYSENAWYATEYAAQIAQKTSARVILFHAIDLPLIPTEVPVDIPSLDELNRHHTVRLREISERLTTKYHINVTHKLSLGSVTNVLTLFFKEQNADLVIMGLRGANPIGKLLMGNVTSTLLKRAQLPVLVIPRDFAFRGIRHILFASDFDPSHSPHTLTALRDIAKAFGANVEVLHLPQPVVAGHVAGSIVDETYWEEQLQDVKVDYTFLYEEDIQKGIDQCTCESHADLLVMVPQQQTFFERLLDKSNARKMVFHTRTPLLALPNES